MVKLPVHLELKAMGFRHKQSSRRRVRASRQSLLRLKEAGD